jgi:hypothetical protein
LTDLEQATLEKTVAERDAIYINAQVILPEEVALSRFRPGGFHTDTMIDLDARQSMLDAEIDKAVEKAGEDEPQPIVNVGGAPGVGAEGEQAPTEEAPETPPAEGGKP